MLWKLLDGRCRHMPPMLRLKATSRLSLRSRQDAANSAPHPRVEVIVSTPQSVNENAPIPTTRKEIHYVVEETIRCGAYHPCPLLLLRLQSEAEGGSATRQHQDRGLSERASK